MQHIFVMSYWKVLLDFKSTWICQLLPSWFMLWLTLLNCHPIGEAFCKALWSCVPHFWLSLSGIITWNFFFNFIFISHYEHISMLAWLVMDFYCWLNKWHFEIAPFKVVGANSQIKGDRTGLLWFEQAGFPSQLLHRFP